MQNEIPINNLPYWLDFISSVIRSLAWPIAIVVVVFVLKEPIAKLISKIMNLNKLSANGIELEFSVSEKIQEVKETLEHEFNSDSNSNPQPDTPTKRILNPELEYIYELALTLPETAITESWRCLSKVLLTEFSINGNPRVLHGRYLRELLNNGDISKDMYHNLRTLQNIKALALHSIDKKLTSKDALNYLYTVDKLISKFNKNRTNKESNQI